jgi:hypothetical protein
VSGIAIIHSTGTRGYGSSVIRIPSGCLRSRSTDPILAMSTLGGLHPADLGCTSVRLPRQGSVGLRLTMKRAELGEQMAVAVVAELLMLRSGRSGQSLWLMQGRVPAS